jgi:hypothetical protein
LKKIVVGLVVVGVLIVAVPIWQNNQGNNHTEGEELAMDGFSIHDLDWEDVEGMNEHVSRMTLNVPPYFMDWMVGTHLDLTEVFRLFGENQHLLRDQPEVVGQTRESDYEVTLTFRNLTGNEMFLNGNGSKGTLGINFYVSRELAAQEVFDLITDAGDAYFREQNPEEVITLADIDWDALREDYEAGAGVSVITIQGIVEEDRSFNIADFESRRDDVSAILEFLEENQDEFYSNGDLEYMYQGTIHFWQDNEDEPHRMAPFFMEEALNRRLMEAIGEEAWERARRQ